VIDDPEACYRALASRDARFDGWFFVGVTSTGIFCRPSCPATTPKRTNARFYRSAAAAQGDGFRACRRCRPDTAPGSPEWNVRGDLAARAVALIDDGLIDRSGVGALARRLAVSERHLHRVLVAELGASPLALARARRALTARILIETTDLAFTDLAFAAGFSSVRQFNDTVRAYFGANPTTLRADRRTSMARGRSTIGAPHAAPSPGAATTVSLRLATRPPFAGAEVIGFLAERTIAGVDAVAPDGAYWRTLALPHGDGCCVLRAGEAHVQVSLVLGDLRDVGPAVSRIRRLLDLDADPKAIDADLGRDRQLAPLVAATPGRRSPGTIEGAEQLVRAIIGQQISVAGARTVTRRLVEALGAPLGIDLPTALGAPEGLYATFPSPAAIAGAPAAAFSMPDARRRALVGACEALVDGELDLSPGADRSATIERLLRLRGIGPWTASYVAMRALGDPDVFLPTDVGVRRGLEAIGLQADPAEALARAERWRPWRSYALHHLWAAPGGAGSKDQANLLAVRLRLGTSSNETICS
jgi:AraC family transcriptional regulator of adaptative response / DNA-3-methyladenine glycosylase II